MTSQPITGYIAPGPSRAEIDSTSGPVVVEFGTDWCGHCQAARASIATALALHPDVSHRKIEDGPGRRTGRSFGVKLWPTLIFLADGREITRVVRPTDPVAIVDALMALQAAMRA